MNNDDIFPFTLDFKENGGKISFDSKEDLSKWFQDEKDKSLWFQKDINKFDPHTRNAINVLVQKYNQIQSILQNLMQYFAPNYQRAQLDNQLVSFKNQVESYYQTGALISSKSGKYKFIQELRRKSDIQAISALIYLTDTPINLTATQKNNLAGFSAAYLFENKLLESKIKNQEKVLEEFQLDWEEKFLKEESRFSKLNADTTEVLNSSKEFVSNTTSDYAELKSKIMKDIDELHRTYDQYMALKAPVEYWENKRDYHYKRILPYSISSIIIGVCIGIGSFFLMHKLFESKDSNNILLHYENVAIAILILTLSLWLLRILVKILLSHFHLEADARERVVMAKTFLSLLRESSGLGDQDKQLILSNLFRPTSSGVIKDDGIPPGLYDLLSRYLNK